MKTKILSICALTLCLGSFASAATLLSNLCTAPPAAYGYIIEIYSKHGGAVGFQTPSAAAFLLDSVTFSLWPWCETNAFVARVELRANAPGEVPAGSALFTFPPTVSPPTVGPIRYTVMAPAGTVLQPNTIYWLVLAAEEAVPDSGYDWESEFVSGELEPNPPSGLASFVGYRYGSTASPGGWWNGTYTPGVAIHATPVPELSAVRSESGMVLRWPTNATDFVLEEALSLSSSAAWEPVTNVAGIVDGMFSVVVEFQPPRRFFRLRRSQ